MAAEYFAPTSVFRLTFDVPLEAFGPSPLPGFVFADGNGNFHTGGAGTVTAGELFVLTDPTTNPPLLVYFDPAGQSPNPADHDGREIRSFHDFPAAYVDP